MAAASSDQIRWPDAYAPERASVFVSRQLTVPAAPETVWAWLIRADAWPEWYPNAAHIHFLSHGGPDLRDRTRFRWQTSGARITSKVLEFEPGRRIAWNTHGIGIEGYHRWRLTPTADGGTDILTEETRTGWRARLHKTLAPARAERMQTLWLENLRKQAQAGLPAQLNSSFAAVQS